MVSAFLRGLLPCLASLVPIMASQVATAEIVQFSGNVIRLEGEPVAGGYVIAGTFNPLFQPWSYKYEYGMDEGGNMDSPNLSQAIADGNFLPIGSGTHTAIDGEFSGSGFNSAGPGLPVYIFAFSSFEPDESEYFALATNPAWVTGASNLSLNAANAQVFVFGQKSGASIALQGLPMPEPAGLALMTLGLVMMATMRRIHV